MSSRPSVISVSFETHVSVREDFMDTTAGELDPPPIQLLRFGSQERPQCHRNPLAALGIEYLVVTERSVCAFALPGMRRAISNEDTGVCLYFQRLSLLSGCGVHCSALRKLTRLLDSENIVNSPSREAVGISRYVR